MKKPIKRTYKRSGVWCQRVEDGTVLVITKLEGELLFSPLEWNSICQFAKLTRKD